jgi:Tfp pilus assembly protein PilZ
VTDQAKADRRYLNRTVTRIPAMFASSTTHGNGHIKNLSLEGLFLRTENLPQTGDVVDVILFIPDGNKIEVTGTVRWTTAELGPAYGAKPGFGIQIHEQSQDYLGLYEELLMR